VGIVFGLVLVATVVTLIALLLVVLTDSRNHIRSQDAKITALYEAAKPAVEGARPLARRLGPLLRDAPPVLRQAAPVVRSLRRGLRSLRGTGPSLADAATAVPPLLNATVALADGTLPLVHGLAAADLPRVVGDADAVLGDADAVLGSLLYRDRLVRVLDATDSALAELRSHDLIARAARTPGLIRQLLKVQRATLRTQKASLAVQLTTRDYARRAAEAAESIDRKLGGQQVPPAPAAAP
jgi:hypothetical protein